MIELLIAEGGDEPDQIRRRVDERATLEVVIETFRRALGGACLSTG
jgi:hypothetical protein